MTTDTLDPESSLIFKQLTKTFHRANIELLKNYEQIIQGNHNLVPPEDEIFREIEEEHVDLSPIE